MTQLFERCAVAFALDLPDGRVPVTDALRSLVDQHRDTAATWLPGLADELRALSLGELGELDYAFMRQFYDDFAACQQEPDRLGIEDHFGFESRLRFVAVTSALERADGTAARAALTPFTGANSPMLRGGTPDHLTERLGWPLLELLVEALTTRQVAVLMEARSQRRSLAGKRRIAVASLKGAFSSVAAALGARRLTQKAQQAALDAAAALAANAAEAPLVFDQLPSFVGVTPVVCTVPAAALGDTFRVTTARPTEGALAVSPVHGGLATFARPDAGGRLAVYLRAFSDESAVVDVVLEQVRGDHTIARHVLQIEARPLAALRLIAEPPPAPAAGASPSTATASAKPGPLARAAALTADPHLRRALERLFAHKVLGENDLFAIGGATLIRQWALAVGDFIAAGNLSITMSVNHEGKRYELRESPEAAV